MEVCELYLSYSLGIAHNVISLQIKERVLCLAFPLWGWQQVTENS